MRVLLLSLVLLGCHNGPATGTTATEAVASRAVDVQTAEAATRAGAFFVDVRTPEEYASGHAAHTVNIPLDTIGPDVAAIQAHKGDPIYLICRSGHRSGIATERLAAAGLRAINVEGGTNAWRQAGLPME